MLISDSAGLAKPAECGQQFGARLLKRGRRRRNGGRGGEGGSGSWNVLIFGLTEDQSLHKGTINNVDGWMRGRVGGLGRGSSQ